MIDDCGNAFPETTRYASVICYKVWSFYMVATVALPLPPSLWSFIHSKEINEELSSERMLSETINYAI